MAPTIIDEITKHSRGNCLWVRIVAKQVASCKLPPSILGSLSAQYITLRTEVMVAGRIRYLPLWLCRPTNIQTFCRNTPDRGRHLTGKDLRVVEDPSRHGSLCTCVTPGCPRRVSRQRLVGLHTCSIATRGVQSHSSFLYSSQLDQHWHTTLPDPDGWDFALPKAGPEWRLWEAT